MARGTATTRLQGLPTLAMALALALLGHVAAAMMTAMQALGPLVPAHVVLAAAAVDMTIAMVLARPGLDLQATVAAWAALAMAVAVTTQLAHLHPPLMAAEAAAMQIVASVSAIITAPSLAAAVVRPRATAVVVAAMLMTRTRPPTPTPTQARHAAICLCPRATAAALVAAAWAAVAVTSASSGTGRRTTAAVAAAARLTLQHQLEALAAGVVATMTALRLRLRLGLALAAAVAADTAALPGLTAAAATRSGHAWTPPLTREQAAAVQATEAEAAATATATAAVATAVATVGTRAVVTLAAVPTVQPAVAATLEVAVPAATAAAAVVAKCCLLTCSEPMQMQNWAVRSTARAAD